MVTDAAVRGRDERVGGDFTCMAASLPQKKRP